MTGPNPRAAAPTRRGHTPQAVPAPMHTTHDTSPSPSTAAATGRAQPARLRAARHGAAPSDRRASRQHLGISRSLPYELLATGDIESITIGRLRRIPADALTTYIQLQRTKEPRPPNLTRTTIHPESI